MRRKEESSQQQQLAAAKRSYKAAVEEGNRQEEARWSNFIGNILKNRGEYFEALDWLRKDYEVSSRHLPTKQLLATCQSMGELYLRLQEYKNALVYQRKHLDIASDTNDLIEQQRASTQLGRTYHEIFLNSDDDHSSVRNAKKYFKSAMALARTIKESSLSEKGSFIKEYIDAHNNLGMLEIDLDNFDEAEKILTKGLKICNEEEVAEDEDTRSRLHHNLGNVYLELRRWKDAQEHIRKDIMICKQIGHCQGEAKGYINLGELNYRNQLYNEAISSYQKALDLAKSFEDEDALANQIEQNINTVRQAMRVMHELKKEEQNLKKLERKREMARGTDSERKCILKQNASIDILIEKSRMILAWTKLHEYAKGKKRMASELYDKEKLSDSFLVIGESYQKLRKFSNALKWYKKGLDTYKSIGSLEGQALAKINIGDVLDSIGDYTGALDAFKEGSRIAELASLPSVQLSALENIHYSHMIRFDDVEEAKSTIFLIDQLKQSKCREFDAEVQLVDCCSETKTDLDSQSSDDRSDCSFSPKSSKLNSLRSKCDDTLDSWNENIPLRSQLQSSEKLAKKRKISGVGLDASSPKQIKSTSAGSLTVGRKRVRVIFSDDEGEDDEVHFSERMVDRSRAEGITSFNKLTRKYTRSPVHESQDISPFPHQTVDASTPADMEKSNCSYKFRGSKLDVQNVKDVKFTGTCSAVGDSDTHGNVNTISIGSCNLFQNNITTPNAHAPCDDHCQCIIFEIDGDLVHMDLNVCGKLSLEQMKVELACFYYLRLSKEKKSRGLVPVIQHMMGGGRILESIEDLYSLKDHSVGKEWIGVSISEMVPKHVMKLYIDCCEKLSELPSMEVVKKLYNLEVPDDEIIVSDCKLQDVSVAPLLNALQLCKTIAVLDLSHNLLGNGTVEKLKDVFISSGQSHGGLVLNLHSNRLGSTALHYISECSVLYARLEVLNISGNRLTDTCASYLSTILQNCKALYSLDLENCSITSRTIDKIADSLNSESVLSHLCLGYNDISGNAITGLLLKLATLRRFQDLNLNGIKLSKLVVDSLCQLAKDCCLSGLMLRNTNIGTEAAVQLIKPLSADTRELIRLDLSFCELTCDFVVIVSNEVSLINGIRVLNLDGNPILEEGGNALATLLSRPQCNLRVLGVSKCKLSLIGVIHILQALSINSSLQELNLAENISSSEIQSLQENIGPKGPRTEGTSETCDLDTNENQLEVADSEDLLEAEQSGLEDICSSHKRTCLSEFQLMQEFILSVKMAGGLKVLDLSNNAFSMDVMERIFSAWCSGGRVASGQRHIEDNSIIHFLVQGFKCCGIKSCCRRI